MRKLLFLLIAASFLAGSCNPDKKKALDLNNKLAGITLDLEKKGNEMGEVFKTAMATKDFTQLKKLATDLSAYLDEKIAQVKNMENINGSEKLKSSVETYLNYEKDLVNEGIMPITNLDSQSTGEEVQLRVQKMVERSKDETAYLDDVKKEQEAYAAKNNFKIEQTK